MQRPDLMAPVSTPSTTAHLVVVGAGIIGLAHAFEAVRAGMRVTVVDREHRATGASIRNFGHACITAQGDALLPLAESSRDGWLTAASVTGIDAWECGTVVAARGELELSVLRELAAARGEDRVVLLDAPQVRDRLGGLGADDIVGGAHLPRDLRVDPRKTVHGIAAWLAANGVTFLRPAQVGLIESDGAGVRVLTSAGEVRGDTAVVCVGHDVGHLFPDLAQERKVRRCTLNMARVATPRGARIAPAVFTTTSLLRYDAFTAMPSAAALRAATAQVKQPLLDVVANVMMTQLPDGSLLVGDSHDYADSPEPFMSEATTDLLLDEAAGLLGVDRLAVLERWQGVYADSVLGPILRESPTPGVHIVTVTSGVGMTLSFGLARATLATL